jgi:hypothetical protein
LFQVLNSVSIPETNKIPISLNVVSSKNISPSSYIITGEVGGNTKYGHQLIRTNFGIIISKGTNMQIGQKLNLEITSVNNQSLTHMINKSVGDFLFAANKNWTLLKGLVQNIQGNGNSIIQSKATSILSNNIETKELVENATKIQTIIARNTKVKKHTTNSDDEENKLSKKSDAKDNAKQTSSAPLGKERININSLIKNLGEHEEIRKLSSELLNLKELIHPSIKEDETLEKWQVMMLPLLNGQYIENHEVKIDRTRAHFLKFIIDINIADNPIQMHGLIGFENDNKTPKTFDLTIQSQKKLDQFIQSRITDIYKYNQNMSNVQGSISIKLQNS